MQRKKCKIALKRLRTGLFQKHLQINTLSSNETLLKDLEVQFAKAKIRTESGKITEEKSGSSLTQSI